MSEEKTKSRREFRNLDLHSITLKYNLPPAARVSILHRISGALLFLSLPIILIPLFAKSVSTEAAFNAIGSGFGGFLLKLILLVLIWGFMHHLCAGIRFLTLDMHYGNEKPQAYKSAKIVFIVSLALTFVFAIKMFGVL